uniref:Uncharacterized protein n=1 Tax=Knipowitschia caucasica TaxID=637954 RepID=A0AAV2JC36_KNICA
MISAGAGVGAARLPCARAEPRGNVQTNQVFQSTVTAVGKAVSSLSPGILQSPPLTSHSHHLVCVPAARTHVANGIHIMLIKARFVVGHGEEERGPWMTLGCWRGGPGCADGQAATVTHSTDRRKEEGCAGGVPQAEGGLLRNR